MQVANFTGVSPSDISMQRLGRFMNTMLSQAPPANHLAEQLFQAMTVDCQTLAARASYHATEPSTIVEILECIASPMCDDVVAYMRNLYAAPPLYPLKINVDNSFVDSDSRAELIMRATKYSSGSCLDVSHLSYTCNECLVCSRCILLRSRMQCNCAV